MVRQRFHKTIYFPVEEDSLSTAGDGSGGRLRRQGD